MKILEQIAEEMCVAARTAPKAKGIDLLEMKILTGVEIEKLSKKMLEIGEREDNNTFRRDGASVLQATVVVVIGTKKQTIELRYCGLCGFKNCEGCRQAKAICVFNSGDLGIALGSAVSVATDHRVDNRIMYTIGLAAIEMGLFPKEVVMALGIPLSATGKNPFFDRR